MFRRILVLTALIGLVGSAPLLHAAETPEYGSKIAPLFKKYCNGCHNSKDREGELVLERYEDVLKGGQSGQVFVPGKSDESLIVQVLTGKAEPAMPPEDQQKPSPEEIALIEAWIAGGAKPPVAVADPEQLNTPKIAPRRAVNEPVTGLAFSPNGRHLAVGRYGSVQAVNYEDRALVLNFGGLRGRVNSLSYSRDGLKLLAAGGEPGLFGEAKMWSISDGKLLWQIKAHQDSLYAAVLSPDGTTVATSSYDQQVKLWDSSTGRELKTLSGHTDAVFDLAFRPDGRILASASGDRTVKLWNVASGERLDTLSQPLKDVYSVAFSPDGKRIIAGSMDNRIRMWTVSSDGKENTNPIVYSRFAHEGSVIKVAYSPDGTMIASAGEDRSLKLWDAETLTERLALERQSDWVSALAFSTGGKSLIAGRLDGTLAVYDTSNGNARPTPAPRLAGVSQRGVQRGTTSRIKITGSNLDTVTAIHTDSKKIQARISPEATKYDVLEIELTASPDAFGSFMLWAVSPQGSSPKENMLVDTVPQQVVVESAADPQDAVAINLPVSVWGEFDRGGDIDRYAFEAKAGQTIVFEVTALTAGSKARVKLRLVDAAGQPVEGGQEAGNAADPLMHWTLPADGRYTLEISDFLLGGGDARWYRLSAGSFRYVTSLFPLSVPANQETEVELIGINLPPHSKVKVPASATDRVEVPLDANAYRFRERIRLLVGKLPESREVEPNGAPQTATVLQVPGRAGGRIWNGLQPGGDDQDLYRFESPAGKSWIIETEAAMRSSPVDTVIEVLYADGRPVPRMLLQATRDSSVTFRPIDAESLEARLVNWEEMKLNEWLYMNGEVVKLFKAPQGPDSGFGFYDAPDGRRACFFDTTATTHAVDEPCYIVEPQPIGAKLPVTGLPVFTLNYVNDDESGRRLRTDSRLEFKAPAAGTYLVRVRDGRNETGEEFVYRLTVREPKPDFNVSLVGTDLKVNAGSGRSFSLFIDRIDGFDGEVRIDISGLPPGFSVSGPLTIQAGQRRAEGVLFAEPNAPQPTDANATANVVTAVATIDGREVTRPVNNLGRIQLGQKPQIVVRMEPAELEIAPGATVSAILKIERNGFDDVVNFRVMNLPHGVIVDNIGLNGVALLRGQNERQIFITADPWVPDTTRTCYAVTLPPESGQATRPGVLHVRKKALASAEPR